MIRSYDAPVIGQFIVIKANPTFWDHSKDPKLASSINKNYGRSSEEAFLDDKDLVSDFEKLRQGFCRISNTQSLTLKRHCCILIILGPRQFHTIVIDHQRMSNPSSNFRGLTELHDLLVSAPIWPCERS